MRCGYIVGLFAVVVVIVFTPLMLVVLLPLLSRIRVEQAESAVQAAGSS